MPRPPREESQNIHCVPQLINYFYLILAGSSTRPEQELSYIGDVGNPDFPNKNYSHLPIVNIEFIARTKNYILIHAK